MLWLFNGGIFGLDLQENKQTKQTNKQKNKTKKKKKKKKKKKIQIEKKA